MENWKEIMEDIRANNAEIERLEKVAKGTPYSQRTEPEITEAAYKAEVLKVENKILYDNARRSLFSDVFPVILGILNRYAGKPYGPKTAEKIRAEAIEKTGCAFYVERSTYGVRDNLCIVPLNESGYNVGYFRNNTFDIYQIAEKGEIPRILDGNKINALPAEKFYLSDCAEYTENPHEHAEEIFAAFAALCEKYRAFDKACSAFNALIPSGMEKQYARDFRGYLSL